MTAETPPPPDWMTLEVDGGGQVLIRMEDQAMQVLAPPGVRIGLEESNEDRVPWRHAIWPGEQQSHIPALTVDPPGEIRTLETREVVELLPSGHHDFVRWAMAVQLIRAWTYGHPLTQFCAEETQARIGNRTSLWVARQLGEAFPSESWFLPQIKARPIPDTADRFLAQVPTAPDNEPAGWQMISWRLIAAGSEVVNIARRALLGLSLESSRALLALRVQLLILALRERAAAALSARVPRMSTLLYRR